jgi:hypothetical protein
MNKPSTADYQRHRKDTLTDHARKRQLSVAYEMAKALQKAMGKRYRPTVMKALRAQ